MARVASAAEAGYLVGLLEGAGCPAEARPIETFSALQGTWGATFVVSVPEGLVDRAARVLHDEAAGHADEPDGEDRLDTPVDPPVNPWKMLTVLAIVAAGSAWAVSHRAGRAAPPPFDREAPQRLESFAVLADTLRAAGGRFASVGAHAGRPPRLAWSDRAGAWVVSIDSDGDGRYDVTRRFADPAVAAGVGGR